jgi:hypothetical protein
VPVDRSIMSVSSPKSLLYLSIMVSQVALSRSRDAMRSCSCSSHVLFLSVILDRIAGRFLFKFHGLPYPYRTRQVR